MGARIHNCGKRVELTPQVTLGADLDGQTIVFYIETSTNPPYSSRPKCTWIFDILIVD